MDGLMLAGRILFAVAFVVSGVGHFRGRQMLAGYIRSTVGLPPALQPAAEAVVVLTGGMLLAGSVMVAAGIYGDLGALLLVAFLVPTTPLMHAFWKLDDPGQRQQQQLAFARNVTYLGASLFLFALFATGGEGMAYTVTDPIWTIR
jgi:putative oxidoreductase